MRFFRLGMSAAGLAALALTTLSACTAVVVDDSGPPPPGPRICTREYDPVCARRGGDRRTFANECLADAAGYRTVRGGECGLDRPPPPDRFCTREYDPVCATRGGDRQTFSNACLADQAGYRIVRDGQCRSNGEIGDGGGQTSFCTREYRPVCARRGADVRTFGNACGARASDYRVISDGPC